MKNNTSNKHLKKPPYMTLKESFKDQYYVILERRDTCFDQIVCDGNRDNTYLDDAEAMLYGCIFKVKKDADIFLDKMIRNNGFTDKEDFNNEKLHYRVMTIKEMFNKFRKQNEEREFAK